MLEIERQASDRPYPAIEKVLVQISSFVRVRYVCEVGNHLVSLCNHNYIALRLCCTPHPISTIFLYVCLGIALCDPSTPIYYEPSHSVVLPTRETETGTGETY